MDAARRLLVPIDFSEASKMGVRYILGDKDHLEDQLVLLHSYRLISEEYSNYLDSPRDLKAKLEDQLKNSYHQFHQSLLDSSQNRNIEFRMEVGFLVNCIISICKETDIDLILYALKCNKKNQILADLLSVDCPPLLLLPETINLDSGLPVEVKEISKQQFSKGWDKYIRELETNSALSYKVIPD